MNVKANRPVAQIVKIVVDTVLHFVQRNGLATVAVDLCPTGYAGADFVAHHITFDEFAVKLVVGHRVGTRTNDAHAPLQHVDELGQLVDRGTAHEGSQGGYTSVPFLGLTDLATVLGNRHGAEFVDHDLCAVQAITALLEYDRPRRCEFDRHCRDQQQRQNQRQNQQRQYKVAEAFEHAVGAAKRSLANRYDRHAAYRASVALDQVGEEHVGHEIDRGRGVLEVVQQLQDAGLRRHRQRQVD